MTATELTWKPGRNYDHDTFEGEVYGPEYLWAMHENGCYQVHASDEGGFDLWHYEGWHGEGAGFPLSHYATQAEAKQAAAQHFGSAS